MSERILKPVTEAGGLRFIRATKLAEDGFTGEVVRGLFMEATPNALNESRLDYKIQEEASGDIVVVNGAGNLGYQMEKVAPGTFIAIDYLGTSTITKGKYKGKPAHNFLVKAEASEDSAAS